MSSKQTVWQTMMVLVRRYENDKLFVSYLKDGWEPFAVTCVDVDGSYFTYHLRKQVEE